MLYPSLHSFYTTVGDPCSGHGLEQQPSFFAYIFNVSKEKLKRCYFEMQTTGKVHQEKNM